ncbi:uncharacterized protein B0T23DRAFT_390057 [Neurospora hispaniola]|uniref:Uncharacterized protein n=1 Tax=Neurospora hispaniola TaxID=588809 RepID=A0AAJ0HYL1_9PEZI|nr:hypothetical protein B0T23DRAFT_390057 [Neurospora hispaniola]
MSIPPVQGSHLVALKDATFFLLLLLSAARKRPLLPTAFVPFVLMFPPLASRLVQPNIPPPQSQGYKLRPSRPSISWGPWPRIWLWKKRDGWIVRQQQEPTGTNEGTDKLTARPCDTHFLLSLVGSLGENQILLRPSRHGSRWLSLLPIA